MIVRASAMLCSVMGEPPRLRISALHVGKDRAKHASGVQFCVDENKRQEEDCAQDGARHRHIPNAPEQPASSRRRGHVEALVSSDDDEDDEAEALTGQLTQ
jgi:hypothetical protein